MAYRCNHARFGMVQHAQGDWIPYSDAAANADELLEACKGSLRIAEAWMKDAAPSKEWEDVKNNPEYAAAKQHADMLREVINKTEGRK